MASAEKIPSVAPKRGRKPKLKAVATGDAPTQSKKSNIFGVSLSDKNNDYLRSVQAKTNQSFSHLLNLCVDNARALDVLKSTPTREPASVRKARETLSKWEKGVCKK